MPPVITSVVSETWLSNVQCGAQVGTMPRPWSSSWTMMNSRYWAASPGWWNGPGAQLSSRAFLR